MQWSSRIGRWTCLIPLSLVVLAGLLASACGIGTAPAASARPSFPAESHMARIQQRGKLISSGKIELPGIGYLNPQTGKTEGFGVDLAEDLAQEIFGEPGHMEWKAADPRTRVPMLQEGVADVNIEVTFILPE